MTGFRIGDQVMVRGSTDVHHGKSGSIASLKTIVMAGVAFIPDGPVWSYRDDELERVDAATPQDEDLGAPAAMSAELSGSSPDDAVDRDAGQHPTGGHPPPMAPVAVATKESLMIGHWVHYRVAADTVLPGAVIGIADQGRYWVAVHEVDEDGRPHIIQIPAWHLKRVPFSIAIPNEPDPRFWRESGAI